jgi:hypothetical protein
MASSKSGSARGAAPARPVPGIDKLRLGTLLGIIASLVIIAAAAMLYISAIASTVFLGLASINATTGTTSGIASSSPSGISAIWVFIPFFATLAIGLILWAAALLELRTGFRALASKDRRYRLGHIGALIGIIGFVLTLVFAALLLSISTYPPAYVGQFMAIGFICIVVGLIIGAIGLLAELLTLYRLGSQYNNSMVEVGAILSIFIGLIGLIILYMGLDDLAK